ncbi:MAG: thiol-disulfide oxidoreductase DCC family protein [Nitritalea sp.]
MALKENYHIVLFDGVCNLCNSAVDFIIRKDRGDFFKVGALQSEAGKEVLADFQVKEDYLDSLIYIHQDKIYYRSRAALEISRKLSGLWPLAYGLIVIPAFIRDPIYDWIARNRYKWFGKRELCRFPSEEERAKFLD